MDTIRNIYKKNQSLLMDFFWRALQIFGREGTSFFAFLIASNLLLPTELSLYTYVVSVVLLIVRFCDFGVSGATSKYVAELKATDEKSIKPLVGGMLLVLLSTVLLAVILIVVWGEKIFPETEGYMRFLIPVLFVSPIFYLYEGVFRGLRKFKLISIVSFSTGVLSLLVSYLLISNYELTGAIISQNIQYILLAFIFIVSFGRISLKIDKKLLGKVLKYALIIGISNIGLYLYTRADVIILGNQNLLEYVSYYEIAYKIFSMILLPSTILGSVVAPRVTEMFAKKEFKGMKKDLLLKTSLLFVFGSVVSVAIYILLPLIIQYVFPQYEYSIVKEFMIIFLVILPLRYVSSYLSTGYITASGNAKIVAFPLLVWGVVNVVLDYLFIQEFGYVGIMYATLISQIGYIFTKDSIFIFKILKKL